MKNVLEKNEYEIYRFKVPFNVALRKKKMKVFLNEQLEKKHPFYDESCVKDYSLRLKNKKIEAQVYVSDEITLEKKKMLFGGVLLKDENNKLKLKFLNYKFIILSFVFAVTLIFLFFILSGLTEKNVVEEKIETPVEMKFDNSNVFNDLLYYINFNEGKIKNVEFSNNLISFEVCNVFPEKILEVNNALEYVTFGPVMYEDNNTVFKLNFITDFDNVYEEYFIGDDFSFFEMRNLLKLYECEILSEDIGNKNISFNMGEKLKLNEFIVLLKNLLNDKYSIFNYGVSSFSIINGNENVYVNLKFDYGCKGKVLEVIMENSDVLYEMDDEEDIVVANENITIQPRANDNNNDAESNETFSYIGAIKTPEGKVLRYYKSNEGKIFELEVHDEDF